MVGGLPLRDAGGCADIEAGNRMTELIRRRCQSFSRRIVELNSSDLHLTTQTPPQIRVHGQLQHLNLPVLGPSDTKALAYSVLTDAQRKRFEETMELDFYVGVRGGWRDSVATSSNSAARWRGWRSTA